MRPIAILTVFLILLAFTSGAGAAPPDYSGGINNEYRYKEVVFLSGIPVKFIGEMKRTERERQDGKIITYNFNLTPEDRTVTGKLTRQVSYLVEYDQKGDKGQTVVRTSLQGIPRETVELNGNRYTLWDFQFSKADIIDNRPAADFYSGNISGRKLYELDNGRGKVLVELSGGSVGYENFWGRTETQLIDYVITGEELLPTVAVEFSITNPKVVVIDFNQAMNQATLVKGNFSSEAGGEITGFAQRRGTSVTITFEKDLADNNTVEISARVTDVTGKSIAPKQRTLTKGAPAEEKFVYDNWQGTYRTQVSDSMTKSMYYQNHEPALASFAGGYLRVINSEMVAQYDFNLPVINGGIKEQEQRKKGTVRLAMQMAPTLERLIVPKFRDVAGHWAEEDILKLYSLEVFDEVSNFFIPDVAMTRLDFTKAVMRASDIRVTAAALPVNNRRNGSQEVSPFKDVPVDHPDYRLMKNAVDKGIIFGMTPELFMPGQFLTRAQAVTILIRALGFEHMAPTPGYKTAFNDDREIPSWARDSIYMAREMGLIRGDHQNRVNANKPMTRAEASAMLVRFLEFLERDLQRDYRENILLYN